MDMICRKTRKGKRRDQELGMIEKIMFYLKNEGQLQNLRKRKVNLLSPLSICINWKLARIQFPNTNTWNEGLHIVHVPQSETKQLLFSSSLQGLFVSSLFFRFRKHSTFFVFPRKASFELWFYGNKGILCGFESAFSASTCVEAARLLSYCDTRRAFEDEWQHRRDVGFFEISVSYSLILLMESTGHLRKTISSSGEHLFLDPKTHLGKEAFSRYYYATRYTK